MGGSEGMEERGGSEGTEEKKMAGRQVVQGEKRNHHHIHSRL